MGARAGMCVALDRSNSRFSASSSSKTSRGRDLEDIRTADAHVNLSAIAFAELQRKAHESHAMPCTPKVDSEIAARRLLQEWQGSVKAW